MKRLEELIENDKTEEFLLTEYRQIYSALEKYKQILCTLSNLRISYFDKIDISNYSNCVSKSIQTCMILHAI